MAAREYGLFFVVNGEKIRITYRSHIKVTAVRLWQDTLLSFLNFHAGLDPLPIKKRVANFVLIPAYCRDYTDKELVIKDWEVERDFIILMSDAGRDYINRQQLKENEHVLILFDNQQQAVFI